MVETWEFEVALDLFSPPLLVQYRKVMNCKKSNKEWCLQRFWRWAITKIIHALLYICFDFRLTNQHWSLWDSIKRFANWKCFRKTSAEAELRGFWALRLKRNVLMFAWDDPEREEMKLPIFFSFTHGKFVDASNNVKSLSMSDVFLTNAFLQPPSLKTRHSLW